jgi:hypothetical protein
MDKPKSQSDLIWNKGSRQQKKLLWIIGYHNIDVQNILITPSALNVGHFNFILKQ